MSEAYPRDPDVDDDGAEQSDRLEELPHTGDDTVDGVLASLDGLAERPVDEHVAVFEKAHEDLRRALDSTSRPGN